MRSMIWAASRPTGSLRPVLPSLLSTPAEIPVPDNTVLGGCRPITQSSYRRVVASIVNAIKAEHHESDQDVADRLGVSAATVNNASNQRGDLSPVTMLNLGRVYGLHR